MGSPMEGNRKHAPGYGFVFIRCQAERRLLMLTQRDPYDTTLQSFDPFKEPRARAKNKATPTASGLKDGGID
jgi:hypothetical protein